MGEAGWEPTAGEGLDHSYGPHSQDVIPMPRPGDTLSRGFRERWDTERVTQMSHPGPVRVPPTLHLPNLSSPVHVPGQAAGPAELLPDPLVSKSPGLNYMLTHFVFKKHVYFCSDSL